MNFSDKLTRAGSPTIAGAAPGRISGCVAYFSDHATRSPIRDRKYSCSRDRIPEPLLAEAQDDATILAIKAQEEAGLDIITDGEIRRESYSNRYAAALEGIDIDHPGTALDRSGHPNPVPRIVGPIRRMRPVEVDDLKFLKRHTSRQVKMKTARVACGT